MSFCIVNWILLIRMGLRGGSGGKSWSSSSGCCYSATRKQWKVGPQFSFGRETQNHSICALVPLTPADFYQFQASWAAPLLNKEAVSAPTEGMIWCPGLLSVKPGRLSCLGAELTWAKCCLPMWKRLLVTCRTTCWKSASVKIHLSSCFLLFLLYIKVFL